MDKFREFITDRNTWVIVSTVLALGLTLGLCLHYALTDIAYRGEPCPLLGMVRVSEYNSSHTVCVAGIDKR